MADPTPVPRGSSSDPEGGAWENLTAAVKSYLGIGRADSPKHSDAGKPAETPQETADNAQ